MTQTPLAPLTVATAQAAAVSGEVSHNVETAASYVRQAADSGARVVVLPELFLPGYDLVRLGADASRDVTASDARLDPLRQACEQTKTVALVGAAVAHDDGRRTISLLSVDDEVFVVYDKQHLWSDEAAAFTPGTHGATVTVDGWPLGLAVCYDGCFPEHARAACADGALAYIAAAAYAPRSQHRRDLYYRARALDNGCYVVVSGLVGTCGGGEFAGGSAIHDPEGRTIAACDPGEQGFVMATLDANVVAATRTSHTMHADHLDDLGERHHHQAG